MHKCSMSEHLLVISSISKVFDYYLIKSCLLLLFLTHFCIILFLFIHYLNIIWTLFEHYLNINWTLFEHHLNNIWTLFEHYLNIIWTLFEHYLLIFVHFLHIIQSFVTQFEKFCHHSRGHGLVFSRFNTVVIWAARVVL